MNNGTIKLLLKAATIAAVAVYVVPLVSGKPGMSINDALILAAVCVVAFVLLGWMFPNIENALFTPTDCTKPTIKTSMSNLNVILGLFSILGGDDVTVLKNELNKAKVNNSDWGLLLASITDLENEYKSAYPYKTPTTQDLIAFLNARLKSECNIDYKPPTIQDLIAFLNARLKSECNIDLSNK